VNTKLHNVEALIEELNEIAAYTERARLRVTDLAAAKRELALVESSVLAAIAEFEGRSTHF
jgi:hypothetical protein